MRPLFFTQEFGAVPSQNVSFFTSFCCHVWVKRNRLFCRKKQHHIFLAKRSIFIVQIIYNQIPRRFQF